MKYAIDEFRVGRWERIGSRPIDLFDEWAEADKFINRLRGFFPLRQYRIVEIDPPKEGVIRDHERGEY